MPIDTARKPLQQLLGLELDHCACGRPHRIPTREVLLQPGALRQLPGMAARHLPPGGHSLHRR